MKQKKKATKKKTKRIKKNERITRLDELNWKQIDDLDRETTVFFLPISPLEEHGPHLPVGTDLFIAEEATKEAIRRIKKSKTKISPILLPSLPIGHSGFAVDFPGTISVNANALDDIIYDTAASLAKHGFRYLMICTYHMDPFYLKALYRGMKKAMSKYAIRIVEPTSSYFYQKEKEGDIHGGYEETSIMRYLYPYLLDSSYKSLPDVHLPPFSKRNFRKTFKELGAKDGYIGEPAKATIDYGKKKFNELVELYVKTAMDLKAGKSLPNLPRAIKWLPLVIQRRK